MAAKRTWTLAEDALVIGMANDNKSTQDIAAAIGCSRTCVRWHCVELGITRFDSRRKAPPNPNPSPDETEGQDMRRDALPPMHPVSWQAIERSLRDHRQGYQE